MAIQLAPWRATATPTQVRNQFRHGSRHEQRRAPPPWVLYRGCPHGGRTAANWRQKQTSRSPEKKRDVGG
eukprot:7183333-Pyramimonas_sp.AAC.1